MKQLLFLSFLLWCTQASSQYKRQGMDRALFFAVAQYQDDRLQHLPQTIKNAREIAQVLKNKYGFETEIIENPSLDDIEAKLSAYRKQYANGDLAQEGQLLIFFSGHGVKEFDNGYFLPADADLDRMLRTGLSYNTWRPFMSQIECQHILIAIDACYSVTFDPKWDSRNGSNGFRRIGELSETERILENHKQYQSRIFLTSDAREDIVPGRSNFARKFLEGLSDLQYTLPFATSSKLFADYIEKAQPSPKGGAFEGDDPRSAFLFFPKTQVNLHDNRYAQRQKDIDAYKTIQLKPNISACQQYLSDFPDGEFRTEVYSLLLQIQEKQEWELASLKDTKESYQVYLNRYPDGTKANEARLKISQIETLDLGNMVFVKGGTFQMGSKDGEKNEAPHTVTLSDFYIGRYEVTFEEYDAFCIATGKEKPRNAGFGRGKRPVIYVNWYDAIEYCNWLSKEHGLQMVYNIDENQKEPENTNNIGMLKWLVSVNWNANGYRLPTEAEWEYAARSRGKDEKWAGTSLTTNLASFANYYEDEKKDKDGSVYTFPVGATVPVGTFKTNDLGLLDMSGNVLEWCWDWYEADYYSRSPSSDPKGPKTGSFRVQRGGSWLSEPASLRCAYRAFSFPDFHIYNRNPDFTPNYIGFRLSRSGR